MRLFRDATEVSGGLGGRLQRRRGHDWLYEQADSGGRLHVNRSGSKLTTREGAVSAVQCSAVQCNAVTVMAGSHSNVRR